MTSSPTGKTAPPLTQTTPSTAPSRHTSLPVQPDQLRLQAERAEAGLLHSALSSLGAVPHPPLNYDDMRALEARDGLIYLGAISEPTTVYYLPRDADLTARMKDVVQSIAPVPIDTGEARLALYELWLTTRHERLSTEDRDAQLILYAKRLADYPAEHSELVLGELAQTAVWFPPWADIRARLDALSGWRARLTAALRRVHMRLKKDAS